MPERFRFTVATLHLFTLSPGRARMSLSGIERWLLGQIVPVVFVGFALLAGLALVYFSAQSRKAARVRDRAGKDEETFAEEFVAYGFDAEIARAISAMRIGRSGYRRPVRGTRG